MKHDSAILDLAEAIRLNPKDAEACHLRGCLYELNGEHDKAIVDLTEAIRLNPNDAEAHLFRGFAYGADLDRAIAEYTEAIRLDRQNANAYYNRAVAYRKKGNFAQAAADFDQAKKLGFPQQQITSARKQTWRDDPIIGEPNAPAGARTRGPSDALVEGPTSARAPAGQGTQLVPVSSSALRAVGYDDSRKILEIQFHNGAVYRYYGVPADVHRGLMGADSHGQYFDQHIRGAGYRYERIK
jgi:tetratricopeptide (TPR) repeat protein